MKKNSWIYNSMLSRLYEGCGNDRVRWAFGVQDISLSLTAVDEKAKNSTSLVLDSLLTILFRVPLYRHFLTFQSYG